MNNSINLQNDFTMEKEKSIRTANILRNIARYTLLVIGILVFIFALFSGAQDYGGGIKGIVKNSPNAIPWLLLLILVLVAWKWELVGGISITLLGLFLLYFFNFYRHNFFLTTFILTLIIPLLGSFFLFSWYLRKDKS
jgi:hypothetical protein